MYPGSTIRSGMATTRLVLARRASGLRGFSPIHNRGCLCGCHRGSDGDVARTRADDRDFVADEVSCHGRQAIKLAFRPAIFDDEVSAFCKTRLAQAPMESNHT